MLAGMAKGVSQSASDKSEVLVDDPRAVLPFVIMSSEPNDNNAWSVRTHRTFDIAGGYGHEMGDWFLSCNLARIGPGTRALIFRWMGHGLPDLGGLMRVTGWPYRVQERADDLDYVDGEIWSLYPSGDQVPGARIAADPSYSGATPLKTSGRNRFQCGMRWERADVEVCTSYLPKAIRDWFWA